MHAVVCEDFRQYAYEENECEDDEKVDRCRQFFKDVALLFCFLFLMLHQFAFVAKDTALCSRFEEVYMGFGLKDQNRDIEEKE
ncbi:hypothetical protein D3C81_1876540 [compost metagenome]